MQLWDFSKGLKNEFETAAVNESSVFEPLKFYCNSHQDINDLNFDYEISSVRTLIVYSIFTACDLNMLLGTMLR